MNSKPIDGELPSTCHWCHVMERESFEDSQVAELMNQHFVAIKVDREERPDIDQIYMGVCQALTGQGGWPLTILMTPDQKPFFAGTYFPKETRLGRMGLMEVLQQIADKWYGERDRILEASDQIIYHLKSGENQPGAKGLSLSPELMEVAVRGFENEFDEQYGGFGSAPKFPTPHNLIFLLRHAHLHHHSKSLQMAEKTLLSMVQGGIYDHIGFGFARYSTDKKWLVPHFEKMLYDNALLVLVFVEAYQSTGNPLFRNVADDILTYVLRDMTDVNGGFYSAEDADSEGVEGRFYTWSIEEVEEVLGHEDGLFLMDYYGMTEYGNFEGFNIPNRIGQSEQEFAQEHGMRLEDLSARVDRLRQNLFKRREGRVHPHKDDKILTAWNGLMMAALSRAGRVFGNPAYVEAAEKNAQFLLDQLRRRDGRLLARYRDGEAAHLGYVDDYAFLIWGLLELYEAVFSIDYLKLALELQRDMLRLFWDNQGGGLFFYGTDGERLLLRPKEIYDGALPSGNSVAALNLLKLGRLTGDSELEEKADQVFKAFLPQVKRYPMGYSFFLMALQFALGPTKEIVVAQTNTVPDVHDPMVQALMQQYIPNAVMVVKPSGESGKRIAELAPYTELQSPVRDQTAVYVCENYSCQVPVTEVTELTKRLGADKV